MNSYIYYTIFFKKSVEILEMDYLFFKNIEND